MTYFLPSFFQKRILRYALSQLDLFETDAIDLDNLEIAWGKRSTVELKDLDIRAERLSSLLSLPSDLKISKSSISNLRLTIPADIYQSSICVDIGGIYVGGKILSDTRPGKGSGTPKKDVESPSKEPDSQRDIGVLPKPEDLAKSFLRTEAPEERAELQAAISSQSQVIDESNTLDSEEGLGGGYSLPGFLAEFLQGISDRLEIRVRDVEINIEVELRPESAANSTELPELDLITLRLTVEDIHLRAEATQPPNEEQDQSKNRPTGNRDSKDLPSQLQTFSQKELGRRRISVANISCWLISDPAIFAGLAKSSGRSSPSTTYSERKRSGHGVYQRSSKGLKIHSNRSASSPLSHRGHLSDVSNNPDVPGSRVDALSSSFLSSDEDRFADAGDTDSLQGSNLYRTGLNDVGKFDGDVDSSAYLDQLSASQLEVHDIGNIETPASDVENQLFQDYSQQISGKEEYKEEIGSPGQSTPTRSPLQSRSADQRKFEKSLRADNIQSSEVFQSTNSQSSDVSFNNNNLPVEDDSFFHGLEEHDDDLSKSKIFSHEEAESMYMSALSNTPESHHVLPTMPGGWDEDSSEHDPQHERESRSALLLNKQETQQKSKSFLGPASASKSDSTGIDQSQSPTSINTSSRMTEKRPNDDQSSSPQQESELGSHSDQYHRVAKNIMYVDKVDVHIPGRMQPRNSSRIEQNQDVPSLSRPKVPGSFSTYSTSDQSSYSELHSPTFGDLEDSTPRISSTTHNSFDGNYQSQPEVNLGTLRIQFDVTIARLVYLVFEKLTGTFISTADNEEDLSIADTKPSLNVKISSERISVKLLERLGTTHISNSHTSDAAYLVGKSAVKPSPDDVLLRMTLKGLILDVHGEGRKAGTTVELEKFVFGYARENIISFDASRRMRASTRDTLSPVDKDIMITIARTRDSRRIFLSSLPMQISVDLLRLDETLGWFGGFSSILGMGNSIISNATVRGADSPSPTKTKGVKGVRFEGAKDVSTIKQSDGYQTKFDARIGAVTLDLISKDCTITATTSALKVVSRGETVGIQIDKIKMSGPLPHSRISESCIVATTSNVRIEYLATPKESDLSRLLSLLTPSKNKYDQDDDILLDTLLRQRRQGSVLRLSISSIRGHLATQEGLECLPTLLDEIGKLSSVTKYLPDDERPGLLSLVQIGEIDLRLALDGALGDLLLLSKGIEIAHVSIPALAATSIQTVHVQYGEDEDDLIGEAVPTDFSEAQDVAPMFMARMIGDEMEPAIKVKLWNVRMEHRVPLLMALLGLSEDVTTEEAIGNIASSVATLRIQSDSVGSPTNAKNTDVKKDKPEDHMMPLKLDIILRDTLIGLNPLKKPCKALVVFTETRIALALPKNQEFQVSVDINNASLLVIDDLLNMLSIEDVRTGPKHFLHYPSPQISDLCASGFVSVSNMRSAQALISIHNDGAGGERYVEVELKDELLVLETCADSTQTLVSVMEGLQPPRPPSTDIKYRTEIVPVEDMLASLSGNAFMSNRDEEYVDEFPSGLDEDDMVEDDVPQNMDFVSSFYQPEPAPTSEDVADSMLSEDLGSLAQPPATRDLKDKVLLEKFDEQYRVETGESLNFREDHFGTGSVIDGKAHRWDSVRNAYGQTNDYKIPGSPLKIRVRDVHVIWNLFDGYDWQKTRDKISKTVKDLEHKAMERRSRGNPRASLDEQQEEEAVIGDFLFNSIYIGIPANRDPRELANMINRDVDDLASEAESYTTSIATNTTARPGFGPRVRGKRLKLSRSKHHKLTFELRGVSADLVVFPPGSGETQSSIDLRVKDFEIFDHVPTSTWKKFATYMHDAGERESGTSMIHLELLTVKPIPDLAASEIVLKVTILPLRLHVDQDALDFMTRFFEFKDDSEAIPGPKSDGPFLQRVEVNSVKVKLDYKPKSVDYAGLRSGHTTEFMNFFILDQANMELRHVILYGVPSFERLSKTLNDVWMPDVKSNQLPGILAGLAPVRPLINVGEGVRDLVAVPIREYQKDGRVVRSLQKGAIAFAKTTTSELVKLGAKLAIGTQTVLQGAEGFLSQPPERDGSSGWDDAAVDLLSDDDDEAQKVISLYADQPVGVVQGLRGAYASLERDLLTAKDAIIAMPGEMMESGNATGAAKAMLRRAPTVIFRPAIGASKAIGQTMLGAANSLDPEERRRTEDKYKRY